jgi:hypothetical protein
MDPSQTRDMLAARTAILDARPPLEKVRDLLDGYVVDTDGWGESRELLTMTAQHTTRPLRQGLDAIDAVLAAELPPGTLLRMVAGEAGKSLDHDPTDAGAAGYLRELAGVIRSVLDEVA